MKIGRLFVLVIFVALFAAFLTGCSAASTPVGTVKAFNKISAKGDLDQAQKFIAQEKRVDAKNFNFIQDMMKDMPAGTKETVDNILHDMTYELVSQEGINATVRATMDFGPMMKDLTGTSGSPLMGLTKISINYILEKREGRWQIVDAKPAMGM